MCLLFNWILMNFGKDNPFLVCDTKQLIESLFSLTCVCVHSLIFVGYIVQNYAVVNISNWGIVPVLLRVYAMNEVLFSKPALRAGRSAEASLALRAHSDPRLWLGKVRVSISQLLPTLVCANIMIMWSLKGILLMKLLPFQYFSRLHYIKCEKIFPFLSKQVLLFAFFDMHHAILHPPPSGTSLPTPPK